MGYQPDPSVDPDGYGDYGVRGEPLPHRKRRVQKRRDRRGDTEMRKYETYQAGRHDRAKLQVWWDDQIARTTESMREIAAMVRELTASGTEMRDAARTLGESMGEAVARRCRVCGDPTIAAATSCELRAETRGEAKEE